MENPIKKNDDWGYPYFGKPPDIQPFLQNTYTIQLIQLYISIKDQFPRAPKRRVLPILGVSISSSHFHIFSSSLFTSAHIIFWYSHLLSSHLDISSSHLHIFSSSYLHISSSHLHTSSSSHLLIFTSTPIIFSPSHLFMLTFSHLHIFTCSHVVFTSYICTSSHLHTSLTFSSFLLSSGPGRCQGGSTKCNRFARNEVRSAKKLWEKLRFNMAVATLQHEMRFDRQKLQEP